MTFSQIEDLHPKIQKVFRKFIPTDEHLVFAHILRDAESILSNSAFVITTRRVAKIQTIWGQTPLIDVKLDEVHRAAYSFSQASQVSWRLDLLHGTTRKPTSIYTRYEDVYTIDAAETLVKALQSVHPNLAVAPLGQSYPAVWSRIGGNLGEAINKLLAGRETIIEELEAGPGSAIAVTEDRIILATAGMFSSKENYSLRKNYLHDILITGKYSPNTNTIVGKANLNFVKSGGIQLSVELNLACKADKIRAVFANIVARSGASIVEELNTLPTLAERQEEQGRQKRLQHVVTNLSQIPSRYHEPLDEVLQATPIVCGVNLGDEENYLLLTASQLVAVGPAAWGGVYVDKFDLSSMHGLSLVTGSFENRIDIMGAGGKHTYRYQAGLENYIREFVQKFESLHAHTQGPLTTPLPVDGIGTEVQSPITSLADELTRLAHLRASDVLTEEEFQAAKRKILS